MIGSTLPKSTLELIAAVEHHDMYSNVGITFLVRETCFSVLQSIPRNLVDNREKSKLIHR